MRHAWIALASFALFGCSSGNMGTTGPDVDSAGGPQDLTGAIGDLSTVAGYPAGPYGTAVGAVVSNFAFKGWFTPEATSGLATDAANGAMYADVSFDDARRSGKKYALVMFAGFL